MENRDKIVELIFSAVDSVNETLPKDMWIRRNENAVLIDEKEGIDSLTLMTLIVAIENKIREAAGSNISLINIITDPPENSNRVRDISYFADYITGILKRC